MGFYSRRIDELAATDKVDLYLFAQPDFPFVQDGTRDGEHIRTEMHEWFRERLDGQSSKVVELAGDRQDRLHAALVEIERLTSNSVR